MVNQIDLVDKIQNKKRNEKLTFTHEEIKYILAHQDEAQYLLHGKDNLNSKKKATDYFYKIESTGKKDEVLDLIFNLFCTVSNSYLYDAYCDDCKFLGFKIEFDIPDKILNIMKEVSDKIDSKNYIIDEICEKLAE